MDSTGKPDLKAYVESRKERFDMGVFKKALKVVADSTKDKP